MNSVFDVRSYGALGDSDTECSDRIQNAIDAAEAAGGGVVWFPEGTYRIGTQLVIDSAGVELAGASRAVKIRNLVSADYAITVSAADCSVRNLLIDCESVGNGGVERDTGSTRFYEENLRVINATSTFQNKSGFGDGLLVKDTKLTHAQIILLADPAVELVPAPGAGFANMLVAVHLHFDVTTAGYTEDADNLAIQYSGGTDLLVVETTGFLDQATDQNRFQAMAEAVFTPVANQAIEVFNNGANFTDGNAANTLSIRCYYYVVPTAPFVSN